MRLIITLCLATLACGSLVADIRSIAQLHDEGLLSDAEYSSAKQRALASAFPPPSTQPNNTATAGTIMIDCVSDGNDDVKVLTVVVPQTSTPIEIRRSCPDVVGFSGDTVHLRPVHVPP